MSPMERLKELVGRLNAHIERLDVDGAQPDNRMTYDDLGDIAEVLKALASDDAVERIKKAIKAEISINDMGADRIARAALSAILSDVLGEE